MKKEIFKVCALGLIAVTLVTGCGKNNMKGKSTTSNNTLAQVSIEEKENINEVVKVDFEYTELDDETLKVNLVGYNQTGEKVWSKDYGTTPKYTGIPDGIFVSSENYTYVGMDGKFDAINNQTGEKIWESEKLEANELMGINHAVEKNEKVYMYSDEVNTDNVLLFDLTDGKYIVTISMDEFLGK